MLTTPAHIFRLLFWAALIFAFAMALSPQPPAIIGETSDKVQHVVAFGVLTTLAVLAYPQAELLRIGERLSFLGAMIELLQSIPSLHRDCDILDWAADTIIVAIVLLAVVLARDVTAGARRL